MNLSTMLYGIQNVKAVGKKGFLLMSKGFSARRAQSTQGFPFQHFSSMANMAASPWSRLQV